MPPFGGKSVNMCLRDALLLTANLPNETFPTIQSAIDDYEQQMFVPIQVGSLQADNRIHTQSEDAAVRAKRLRQLLEERNRQQKTKTAR